MDRTIARYIVVLLVWIATLSVAEGRAQPIHTLIDSLGTQLVADHPGGVVIGVVAAGTTDVDGYPATGHAVFGFGAVDSTGTPPTAQTVFEIGSVTKTFTGLLLAEAIERGAVQPDDPVTRYLPDSLSLSPSEQQPITLLQLVTHRSGLPRIPPNLLPPVDPTDPYAHYTVADLYAFLEEYQPSNPSDSAYAYSNLGMGLLGHALAQQADTSYAALVQQRIAEPLDLEDTRITLTEAQEDRFAQGYNPAGAPTPPWHIPVLAGAGALRSTAEDMLVYVRAHLTASDTTHLGQAMRRATMPIANADLGDNPGFSGTHIAYGWHITPRAEQAIVWHNGGTGGFSSFIGFNCATEQGVVVLTSMGGIASQVTSAGFTLLRRLSTASR